MSWRGEIIGRAENVKYNRNQCSVCENHVGTALCLIILEARAPDLHGANSKYDVIKTEAPEINLSPICPRNH